MLRKTFQLTRDIHRLAKIPNTGKRQLVKINQAQAA